MELIRCYAGFMRLQGKLFQGDFFVESKKKKRLHFPVYIKKILGNKITQQPRALSLPRSRSFQLQQEEECPGVLANPGPSPENISDSAKYYCEVTTKLLGEKANPLE